MHPLLAALSQPTLDLETSSGVASGDRRDPAADTNLRRRRLARMRGRRPLPDRAEALARRGGLGKEGSAKDSAAEFGLPELARALVGAFPGVEALTVGTDVFPVPGVGTGAVVLIDRRSAPARGSSVAVARPDGAALVAGGQAAGQAVLGSVFAILRQVDDV
jgi:hypothetical protein